MDQEWDLERIPTMRELVARMNASRERLDSLISTLSSPELTEPGAEGWSVKDHLAHLAAWENSLVALLAGKDRPTALGLPDATEEFEREDIDRINARIQEQSGSLQLDRVLDEYRSTHARLLAALGGLTDADLARPYSFFQPGSDDARPVVGWIAGNTYEHYDEHLTDITAILDEVGPTI